MDKNRKNSPINKKTSDITANHFPILSKLSPTTILVSAYVSTL